MRKEIIGALAIVGLVAFVPTGSSATTGVLCIKATGKGAVKVRNPTCKPSEVQVGSFDTATPQASWAPQDISARVELMSNQSVLNNDIDDVSFSTGTEIFDTAGLHDETTNPERLTAPVAGKYLVYGWVTWDGSSGGDSRYLAIAKNDSGFELTAAEGTRTISGSSYTQLNVVTHVELAAGDWVTLRVLQDSGSALNVLAGSFGMVKVP